MWLSNVHPVTWQNHLEDLLVFGHFWENLSLDRGGPVLNSINDRGVEKVKTGVDLVGDEHWRLLHEFLDSIVLISNNDAIFGWVLDLGHHDGTIATVGFVEFDEGFQWIMANNIGVENKEEVVGVVGKDDVLGEADWTSSSKWLVLKTASNLDLVHFFVLFELLHHYLWLVINSQNNLGNTSLSQCLNLMAKNWQVAEVHQWLRNSECEWSESGTETAYEDQSFHLFLSCFIF